MRCQLALTVLVAMSCPSIGWAQTTGEPGDEPEEPPEPAIEDAGSSDSDDDGEEADARDNPDEVVPDDDPPEDELTPDEPLVDGEFVPDDTFEIAEVNPEDVSAQQEQIILLDSVVYEDSWWSFLDLGASIYDPRRDVLIARWSGGLSSGYRFDNYGAFGLIQYDQSLDFTLDIEQLSLLNLGVGVEYLNFLGHVRSTLMVGTSILLSRTPIDEPGEAGWFIELRPGALRWALADGYTIELSPIALDIVAPVTEGIPLVIYSYSTLVGVEWAMMR